MNSKSGDSRQQIIPPTRTHVEAGFVVYAPKESITKNADSPDSSEEEQERSIVILNDGELVAREKDSPNDIVFTMHPGDLVGVASLLEREPLKYEIVATKASDITLVNEECMESELKRLPLWLLAVIKNLSSKTRHLKQAAVQTRVENTVKSLALFLSKKPAKKGNEPILYNFAELIQEFSWITKIDIATIQLDFKGLYRRNLVDLSKKDNKIFCKIVDNELLNIFVDYQEASDSNIPFEPYKLSLYQKKVMVLLSALSEDQLKDSPNWLAFIKKHDESADVTEWIRLQKLGWFKSAGHEQFHVDLKTIRYFLKALRYETNIRGVL
ncbi:MAG: cyclic nucleotide-binding domain-containing protein [Fibrobacter sp.]|nr:cyclic nucleotide-binding domain-containing protein [Fibrobacter sp.]